MAVIYGVDTEKEFSAIDVRDAVITCFSEAHVSDLGVEKSELNTDTSKEFSKQLMKKFFQEIGADFEAPSKDDLIKLCGKLQEFAKNFREPELIKKHYSEIMQLVEKL